MSEEEFQKHIAQLREKYPRETHEKAIDEYAAIYRESQARIAALPPSERTCEALLARAKEAFEFYRKSRELKT